MRLIACFAALATLTASSVALSVGEIADVTVVDRDSGTRLTPHYYHGEYWVAGRPGGKYSVEIRNHLGIIEHPRKFATTIDPFPASPDSQYVPDPPGGS